MTKGIHEKIPPRIIQLGIPCSEISTYLLQPIHKCNMVTLAHRSNPARPTRREARFNLALLTGAHINPRLGPVGTRSPSSSSVFPPIATRLQ